MKRFIARALAWAYHRAVRIWHACYRRFPSWTKKVDAKVISIGNITWGGTGKTPLTIKLAKDLSDERRRVSVLTRGYGQDEVKELRRKLHNVPVMVGKNRVRSAQTAIREHQAEILILDDGFQHLKLHRDLDVVILNSTEPFGPGGLIPLGTLREPIENLARADIFVLTKCDVGQKNVHWIRQKLNTIKPNAVIFEAIHKPVLLRDPIRNRTMPLGDLKGKKIGAISAIGDPYSFEKNLEMLGAEIVFAARYRDHHTFKNDEISYFAKQAKMMGVREAVTTEKDWARLEPVLRRKAQDVQGLNFWVLEIEFQVDDEENFIRRCLDLKRD